MGGGASAASLPDVVHHSDALAYCGEHFSERQWSALPKDESGGISRERFTQAAAEFLAVTTTETAVDATDATATEMLIGNEEPLEEAGLFSDNATSSTAIETVEPNLSEIPAVATLPLTYEYAVSSGLVKTVRLVSLGEGDKLIIRSIDWEINDDNFSKVGICSYTWGFDRVQWHDEETGLTWEIADRAEVMCRAALKFYPHVWIDGLCMVQAWPDHIAANMKIMGKLYWHGTVVPEMILDRLSAEYPLRGWVQQEISFTNLTYSITPLQKYFDENEDLIKKFEAFLAAEKASESDDVEMPQVSTSFYSEFTAAVNASMPYFSVLSRAVEGRSDPKAIALQKFVTDLMEQLQRYSFMYGTFGPEVLVILLRDSFQLTGRLVRESSPNGLCHGAVQGFRTGFFRFNSDRTIAAFSLAEYVLKLDSKSFKQRLDMLEPEQRQYVTVVANPGRWCTGLAPLKKLSTCDWPQPFQQYLSEQFVSDSLSDRKYLDEMFAILHGVSADHITNNYSYVIGWEQLSVPGINSCHFGLRSHASSGEPVRGLITVNIPVSNDKFEHPHAILNNHIKLELGVRLLALINSSWHVYQMHDPEAIFPTDTTTLRLLDIIHSPPFGLFRQNMKHAIFHVMLALGTAASMANAENASVHQGINSSSAENNDEQVKLTIRKDILCHRGLDITHALWGDDSYEHVQL